MIRRILLTLVLMAAAGSVAHAQVPQGTGHKAILTWTSSTGATGYNVYRALSPAGPFSLLTVTPTVLTGYTDTSVTSGTAYSYCVSALVASFESPCSNVVSGTIPKDPVAAPTLSLNTQ